MLSHLNVVDVIVSSDDVLLVLVEEVVDDVGNISSVRNKFILNISICVVVHIVVQVMPAFCTAFAFPL